jgi:putative endonuclease
MSYLKSGKAIKFGVSQLVYFEEFSYIREAIYREKCLKKWSRSCKINLIESHNPEWRDLYGILFLPLKN